MAGICSGQSRAMLQVNLTVPVSRLAELAEDPDVVGISLDAPIVSHLTTATETALRKTLALPRKNIALHRLPRPARQ